MGVLDEIKAIDVVVVVVVEFDAAVLVVVDSRKLPLKLSKNRVSDR